MILAAVAVFLAVTAWLFVFPAHGMPAHMDAIAMLDGPGDSSRVATTLRLAREHRAPAVLISRGTKHALVTVPPQATRARLRLGRCFAGYIYVVTAPLPAGLWPYEIAYEWGATLKALLLQRGC